MIDLTSATTKVSDAERRALDSLKRDALASLRRSNPEAFANALQSASEPKSDDLVVLEIGKEGAANHLKLTLGGLGDQSRRELGKLQAAGEQFEAVMLKQLFSLMQRSVPKNNLDGPMSDLARDMFDQTVSEELAKQGSVGIAPMLFKQLSQRILQHEAARSKESAKALEVTS